MEKPAQKPRPSLGSATEPRSGAPKWLEVLVIGGAFVLPLSLLYPLDLKWTREQLVGLYQTVLLFWTLVGAVLAAYFAARSWRTALDALHVSNYLAISDQWNETYERLVEHPAKQLMYLRRTKDIPRIATEPREITPEEWLRVKPLVQEIFTTFDAWLVQNQLKAYPVLKDVRTWDWWYNTIVGYFIEYPLLIDVGKGTGDWSPFLRQAIEEAERRLAAEKSAAGS